MKEKGVCDVQIIVRNIVAGARNELERLRAVWVWLCNNIGEYSGCKQCSRASSKAYNLAKTGLGSFSEYDVSGYLGHSEKLSSPEDVIASGRGVCCGYSSLCMQMCR